MTRHQTLTVLLSPLRIYSFSSAILLASAATACLSVQHLGSVVSNLIEV